MSDLFKLNWSDIGKALLIIIGTPIVTSLLAAINGWALGGDFPTWTAMFGWLKIGIAAGITYLVKNYFTNSNNKLLTPEKK